MKTGQKGLQLIKDFEGWYSKPYLDPIGIPTIGYGFTYYMPSKRKVTMGDVTLTRAEGDRMLAEILCNYENDVRRLVTKSLRQQQFDALVSFTYNLGGSNLSKSTLLKKVNRNPEDKSIAEEFVKWNKAGGKVLSGLTRRRVAESKLYFS
ncbi:lysozyme [Sphingobacterium sp. SRCM116780]|uniref:lysozyme n=1 Tax=Sphingobacterium sp. SRCM116780 TaxID=2907623 RepID=UPI001F2E986A|nr:lysozyme [Sphingobacterium sp. SRCM116780]UIR56347.1 lysozyme [Sphingobacterium sp. SRCM116780]